VGLVVELSTPRRCGEMTDRARGGQRKEKGGIRVLDTTRRKDDDGDVLRSRATCRAITPNPLKMVWLFWDVLS
jgi:hypothetical protein